MTADERFTVEAAVDGNLTLSDLRMDPAALAHQAAVAKEDGHEDSTPWSGAKCWEFSVFWSW